MTDEQRYHADMRRADEEEAVLVKALNATLLPCPFCKERADLHTFFPSRGVALEYYVMCRDCSARTDSHVDPEIAASKWQRRAT